MMPDQTVILVDEQDKQLGYASRRECHTGEGKMHRAFVTLLFTHDNKVLLQKRKHMLFDNLWDLTAISHPLHLVDYDETYQQASDRALTKEFGINHVPIQKIGGFSYFAEHGEYCENEYCAVLVGQYDGLYTANSDEVYEAKVVPFTDFMVDINAHADQYTIWARKAVPFLQTVGA